MKHAYFWQLLLFLLVLAGPLHAQNYRPFRPRLSYQFNEATTPGDTVHVLRLLTGTRQGPDSVYSFNGRTRKLATTSACNFRQHPDNLFGATLWVKPGAVYELGTYNGLRFVLRPRLPLGQSWPATAAGLTARVTGRALGTVLGQPDSLVTITLSDGAVIQLSKTYGWVSGPALGRYLQPRLPAKSLTLTALPERRLGTAVTGQFAYYDYQPNDVFLRQQFGPGSTYVVSWIRDSVLTRSVSAAGDTVSYQIWSRTLRRTSSGSTYMLSAPQVQVVKVPAAAGFSFDRLTNSRFDNLTHFGAFRTAAANGRITQQLKGLQVCAGSTGDSIQFGQLITDAEGSLTLGAGLGEVQYTFISFMPIIRNLVGYRKGNEQWGTLTPFSQILSAQDKKPRATTTAFPNPFGTELTVRFEASRTHQAVGVLYDALGRQVVRVVQPAAAGYAELHLETATLPTGIYSLQLLHDGRTEVLKVVKAE